MYEQSYLCSRYSAELVAFHSPYPAELVTLRSPYPAELVTLQSRYPAELVTLRSRYQGGVSQSRTEPLSNTKAKVDQSEFSVFIKLTGKAIKIILDGRTDGRTERRTDGRKDGRTDGRTECLLEDRTASQSPT